MYTDCKLYGPYTRKDGRQHLIVIYPDKARKTVSYPKYLMEIHLNRYLDVHETIDHIDKDFTNNDISNLQILNRKDHAFIDAKRIKAQFFNCPTCKNNFKLDSRKLHDAIHNRRRGKSGPFCSRSCAGKYGASIQNNKIEKQKVILIKSEHFYLNKT